MSEMTLVRFLLLYITGMLLLCSLISISGRIEPGRLKRRSKRNNGRSAGTCRIIICIYLLLLLAGLVFIFAILRFLAGKL